MCIFTAEQSQAQRQNRVEVTNTNIFARHTRPGHQAIAYSMRIASRAAAAMILPVPVVPGSDGDAVRFIDLSGYEAFFDDLSRACEPEFPADSFGVDSLGEAVAMDVLPVHEVGDFEASYVPTMTDFDRLHPRFRLRDEIWRKLPDYSDYGFAVFQLKIALMDDDREKENTVHPMAFEFLTRDRHRLYFPTVHVHDGDFHEEAGFAHILYCQRDDARDEFRRQRVFLHNHLRRRKLGVIFDDERYPSGAYDWYLRSLRVASELMPIGRCQGLIDPARKLHAMILYGNYPNVDIWLGETPE